MTTAKSNSSEVKVIDKRGASGSENAREPAEHPRQDAASDNNKEPPQSVPGRLFPLMDSEEIQERAKQMLQQHNEEREQWQFGDGPAAEICEAFIFTIGQLTQSVTFWLSELAAQQAEINRRLTLSEAQFNAQTAYVANLQAENTALKQAMAQSMLGAADQGRRRTR